MTCVLWDWNGTLLDDTAACLTALNAMLARRGVPTITLDFYRQNFSFPVRPFYERIGVKLAQEDWDALAREYHDTYHAQPFALNVEAIAALEAVRAAGLEFRLYGVNSLEALRRAKELGAVGFTCNFWREAFDWAEKIGGIALLK